MPIKPGPKPKPPVMPKPTPKPKPKPKPPMIKPGPPRPPNGPPPANGNMRPLPMPIDPGLLQPVAPPSRPQPVSPPMPKPTPKPKPMPKPPMIKPGPPKARPVPPSTNPGPPQQAPTVRPVVKPVNRRSPAQKVANAIARLPSQQNVEKVRRISKPVKPVNHGPRPMPPRPTRQSIERDMKAGRRPVLGSTSSTTSTSHDPRRFHREESAGLGASTSTTTSSRTSGAYRFEDPRQGHRWG